MKILIACEYSGRVRDAFSKLGHDAVSCDILPTDNPGGMHVQGDVLPLLNNGWDMLIAFPPCTYLCSSGLHWNKRVPERQKQTESALRFVEQLLNAPIPKIALENPVGCISSKIRKPDQIIQPHMFGDDASKKNMPLVEGASKIETNRNG